MKGKQIIGALNRAVKEKDEHGGKEYNKQYYSPNCHMHQRHGHRM